MDKVPSADKELLMCIDIGAANGYNLWIVRTWNEKWLALPF